MYTYIFTIIWYIVYWEKYQTQLNRKKNTEFDSLKYLIALPTELRRQFLDLVLFPKTGISSKCIFFKNLSLAQNREDIEYKGDLIPERFDV